MEATYSAINHITAVTPPRPSIAIISIGMLGGELGPEQNVSSGTDTCTSGNTVLSGLDAKDLPETRHWRVCWLFWMLGGCPE
jgi:hypothetical protein